MEEMVIPNLQMADDNGYDEELEAMRKDHEMSLKMIDLLEAIKGKLERKVCLLMKNCKCSASNERDPQLRMTNKQLANLYDEYVDIIKIRNEHITNDDEEEDMEEEDNKTHVFCDDMTPQVILNVGDGNVNLNHYQSEYDSSYDSSQWNVTAHDNYRRILPKPTKLSHVNLRPSMTHTVTNSLIDQNMLINGKELDKRIERELNHIAIENNLLNIIKCSEENCQFETNTQKKMSAHMKRCHSDNLQPKYKCGFGNCDHVAKYMPDLIHHRRIHTGEKPFKCTWEGCNYSAAQKFSLTFHYRLHTGEKPYKCDWPGCEYRSRHSYSMVHHKRGHTGEKKYKCDFPGCNYEARMLTDFKRHHSRHTGNPMFRYPKKTPEERESCAFKCEFPSCGMKCKSLGYLKSHLKRKHNIDN